MKLSRHKTNGGDNYYKSQMIMTRDHDQCTSLVIMLIKQAIVHVIVQPTLWEDFLAQQKKSRP